MADDIGNGAEAILTDVEPVDDSAGAMVERSKGGTVGISFATVVAGAGRGGVNAASLLDVARTSSFGTFSDVARGGTDERVNGSI